MPDMHPKGKEHVWVVVRYDADMESIEAAFTVKEIVSSQELAEAEAKRLNELNADKGVRYYGGDNQQMNIS